VQLSAEERLIRLLNDLAASNFQITADQRVRTFGLFMHLTLEDGNHRGWHRLGNLLGPVLCRSAEEQVRFHRIFKYWFPDEQPPAVTDNPEDDGETVNVLRALAEERKAAVSEAKQRLLKAQQVAFHRQLRLTLTFVLLMFLLSVVTHFALRYFAGSDVSVNTDVQQQPGQVAPTVPTIAPTAAPTATSRPSPQPIPTNVPPGKPAETANTEREASFIFRWWSAINQTLGPATTLVLMIPITLLAMAVASSKKLLSAYARQTQVLPTKELRNLLSQGINCLEPGERFYHDVQPLRRRIDLPSNDLDVERTINTTIAQAGAFSPVYANRRASPEYVALIDKRSYGDHLASYSSSLIRALEQAGVNVVVYYFDRDPRRVTLGSGQRVLDLDDLAYLSETHRIFIFSDGEGFIDPTTGAPFKWMNRIQDWRGAFLFTWKALQDWNRAELLLETRLGLRMLPATEEGLIIAAFLFDSELGNLPPSRASLPRSFLPDRKRLHGFFATSGWRWLDDIAPLKEEIGGLIARLRAELSPSAFEWLTALAVYPAIYWSLTLYLGSRLLSSSIKGENTFQSALLEIARLPWLQFSHMPQWLREYLILEMSSEQRDRVRTILEQLLLTVSSTEVKDVSMEMGIHTDEAKRRLLERLDHDEHRRDQILIDFMTRKQAESSDFLLRSKVARALGLHTVDSPLRSFFSHKDLEVMRLSASEIASFIEKYPPKAIFTTWSDYYPARDQVLELTKWIDRSDMSAVPPFKLCFIKLDPRESTRIVVDDFSLSLWKRRKRLTLRFGLLGLAIMAIALSLYGDFWNTLSSFGAGILTVAALIYVPPILFWLLLIRPYSRMMKNFPTVSESLLGL
jgi:hypothetical protein